MREQDPAAGRSLTVIASMWKCSESTHLHRAARESWVKPWPEFHVYESASVHKWSLTWLEGMRIPRKKDRGTPEVWGVAACKQMRITYCWNAGMDSQAKSAQESMRTEWLTEPAFVGEGFIREEMFAQRSRSRLSTQEVKRIVGRKTHLTKEGEGILGRVGGWGWQGGISRWWVWVWESAWWERELKSQKNQLEPVQTQTDKPLLLNRHHSRALLCPTCKSDFVFMWLYASFFFL